MKTIIVLMLLGTSLYASAQNKNNTAKSEGSSKDTVLLIGKAGNLNIDIVQSSPNQARVLSENEHVRVVEYFVRPGDKDVWHTHPARSSYVVSGGKVRVHSENGEPKISEVKTGTSSWAVPGARHYVENIGDTDIKIILTEIKSLQ